MSKSIVITLLVMFSFSCKAQEKQVPVSVVPGAAQTDTYLPLLKEKKVGIVANHTSLVGSTHLVDTLISLGIDITKIFALEHGFRGDADAGQQLEDQTDLKTGISIISLYGKHYKPTPEDLQGIDILVFDIQDVGVRFYTYLSSLHYVLEAASDNAIPLVLLDRPNPNGFYVDGPLLDSTYKSFVGIHPIPIVHGMTLGELATMMIGENWINQPKNAQLIVIKCLHYTHDSIVNLDVNPSPNLQTMKAIFLYPTLGLFEGTIMSVGRGTEFPFLVFGHPNFPGGNVTFTPKSIPGASMNPKYKDQPCKGMLLNDISIDYLTNQPGIHLEWIILAYKKMGKPYNFFNSFFMNLSGTNELKSQIEQGWEPIKIRKSWEPELEKFIELRKKYLLYEE